MVLPCHVTVCPEIDSNLLCQFIISLISTSVLFELSLCKQAEGAVVVHGAQLVIHKRLDENW